MAPHPDYVIVTIQVALGGIGGGVIGGFITHFLTYWRERQNRKRAFLAYVKSVRTELETIDLQRETVAAKNPYFLYDWQKEMIPAIRTKCCDILADVRPAKATALFDLLILFSHQMARDVDPYQGKEPGVPLLFEDARRRLIGILEKMMDCAD